MPQLSDNKNIHVVVQTFPLNSYTQPLLTNNQIWQQSELYFWRKDLFGKIGSSELFFTFNIWSSCSRAAKDADTVGSVGASVAEEGAIIDAPDIIGATIDAPVDPKLPPGICWVSPLSTRAPSLVEQHTKWRGWTSKRPWQANGEFMPLHDSPEELPELSAPLTAKDSALRPLTIGGVGWMEGGCGTASNRTGSNGQPYRPYLEKL